MTKNFTIALLVIALACKIALDTGAWCAVNAWAWQSPEGVLGGTFALTLACMAFYARLARKQAAPKATPVTPMPEWVAQARTAEMRRWTLMQAPCAIALDGRHVPAPWANDERACIACGA